MVTSARRRRSLAVLVLTATVTAALALTGTPSGHAKPGFTFVRHAGTDRYDTAAKIATATFDAADVVVIASGQDYPDALAATYAAGLTGVPTLLVARDSVPRATADALDALGTTKALIIGGTGVISEFTQQVLTSSGLATIRIAGSSRYATARAIAESAGADAVGTLDAKPTAIVASGENYPDALSVGAVAFRKHFPVLLTPGTSLGSDARTALDNLGIGHVLLAGGAAAVSSAVQTAIEGMGIAVTRLAGTERTATAAAVADFAIAKLGFGNVGVSLASAADFADALAGAGNAGMTGAVQLLSANQDSIGDATETWLSSHAATLASGVIDGGLRAIGSAAESQAVAAATTGTTTTTTSSSTSTTVKPTTTTTTTSTTTTTLLPVPTTLPPTTLPPASSTSSTTLVDTTVPVVPIDPDDYVPAVLEPCSPKEGPGTPLCFDPVEPPPSKPQFVMAQTFEGSPTITVLYNEPVVCSTVPAEHGFVIKVVTGAFFDDAGRGLALDPAAVCEGETNPVVSLSIAEGYFQLGQSGTVGLLPETLIEDEAGNQQHNQDVVSWSVDPASAGRAAPPLFVRTSVVDGANILEVNYSEDVICSSVASEQFAVHVQTTSADQQDQPYDGPVTAVCQGVKDPWLDLILPEGITFVLGQTGTLTVRDGLVSDRDGYTQPKDNAIAWAVAPPPD
jgi:putative cell wall-binding protein